MHVQVRQDDLLEAAETYIGALRTGKEFIADTKAFQVSVDPFHRLRLQGGIGVYSGLCIRVLSQAQ